MADQQVVTIRGSNLGSSILEEAVIDGFKATLQGPLFRPARLVTMTPGRSGTA